MSKYQTKQKSSLVLFLEQNSDVPLSVAEMAKALKNENISLSAIYRNITTLEKEGKLIRHTKGGNREIYYQYIAAPCCKQKLHISCKKCGKISHLETKNADIITQVVSSDLGFELDKTETILYGICKNCGKV